MSQPSARTRPYNSWDAIKICALFLMFIDHIGLFFYPDDHWIRAIGRVAAPVFLFLAGYSSSYRFRWDLLLLAIAITASGLCVSTELHPLNILFTILLARAIFDWFERRHRYLTHPYEWYVGCVVLFSSMVVLQYGSFGLLFAICGYLRRHGEHYPKNLQRNFMLLTFITYGAMCAYFNYDTLLDRMIMTISLSGAYIMLWNFRIRDLSAPASIQRAAMYVARYSGYIYAIHIIVLEWITGIPY